MKMKRILVSLVCCLCLVQLHAQQGLPVNDFEKLLKAGQSQVLDVRTAEEFKTGHLANALQADWLKKEQFYDRVKYLDKTKPVLVYCASGVRSAQAAQWMKDNGFSNVQNLNGGMAAWKRADKAVEAPANLPQMSWANYLVHTAGAKVVLVDFGAEWCPPCKKMEPVLAQLKKESPVPYSFLKVDGGNDVDVMKAAAVDGIPTFIIYRNGKETWRKQGIVDLAELKAQLKAAGK